MTRIELSGSDACYHNKCYISSSDHPTKWTGESLNASGARRCGLKIIAAVDDCRLKLTNSSASTDIG